MGIGDEHPYWYVGPSVAFTRAEVIGTRALSHHASPLAVQTAAISAKRLTGIAQAIYAVSILASAG